jgi:hypothetical protein
VPARAADRHFTGFDARGGGTNRALDSGVRLVVLSLALSSCTSPASTMATASEPPLSDPPAATAAPVAEPAPPGVVTTARAPRPVVAVTGRRAGLALHVEIIGRATALEAGSPFEQTERWAVTAELAGEPLDRLVNGPSKITRVESRRADRWDVEVSFGTAFAFPESSENAGPEISVTPPGAAPSRFAIDAQ